MARWQPDARSRLAASALDLYAERGFEGTTVAEIAERAGLTKRTFFRHYADKREVLFSGTEELEAAIVGGVRGAPADATPLDAVLAGLDATAPFFVDRWEHARRRQAIIEANSELQERELIKMSRLAGAVAGALRERGVEDPAAELTAVAGMAVFSSAFARWVGAEDDGAGLGPLIHDGAQALRTVALA
ncbi:TetR family transcriptional regulator [Baekduia sp. Peel2402]|uniref:TetR family transcriptional regulator n=1 Tax=Baekduia sp. Peel2402 TaxID=3458296 RepID=UPI00403E6F95